MKSSSRLAGVIKNHEKEILADWIKEQLASTTLRGDLLKESELREQSRAFLAAVQAAVQKGGTEDLAGPAWADVKQLLAEISRARSLAGFSPSETATFVLSLKQPLFSRMTAELKSNAAELGEELWSITLLLDKLGLFTIEAYLKSRESVIERQQTELLELSTPVVELWDDIVALPLVGTLDSNRTQIVMETLLQKIVQTGASIAIIDITGVPTVDTLVAQHLLKTVAATRLMGADCIISGIRPQIAQTIVHLGVNLGEVTTKASLADAFQVALKRTGATIGKAKAEAAGAV
ncbi:anti-anti-sigma factor [Betaproteobacteria bacterium SCGC AG-212-J23]|nr:anti-anti-sigma factor [Betaproteobacteria bacterium SCGC AG-212-J23]